MSSHEALTQAVVSTGHKLVQAGHFAARDVAARVRQLESAVDRLRAEAARRRRWLQQAQEAQQFLTEVRGRCGPQGPGLGMRTPRVYTALEGDPHVGLQLSGHLLSPPPPAPKVFLLRVSQNTGHWVRLGLVWLCCFSKPVVLSQCFTSESPGTFKKY